MTVVFDDTQNLSSSPPTDPEHVRYKSLHVPSRDSG